MTIVNGIKTNHLMKKNYDLLPLQLDEEKVKEKKSLKILTPNKFLTLSCIMF